MVIKRKGKSKIVGLATTVIVVSMILGISMRIIKQQERNEIQRNYQGRLISELKDADMRIETTLKEYDSKDLAYIALIYERLETDYEITHTHQMPIGWRNVAYKLISLMDTENEELNEAGISFLERISELNKDLLSQLVEVSKEEPSGFKQIAWGYEELQSILLEHRFQVEEVF